MQAANIIKKYKEKIKNINTDNGQEINKLLVDMYIDIEEYTIKNFLEDQIENSEMALRLLYSEPEGDSSYEDNDTIEFGYSYDELEESGNESIKDLIYKIENDLTKEYKEQQTGNNKFKSTDKPEDLEDFFSSLK